ncbi:MAG: alpha/beta hydrolase [Ancrocorticia sp.]|nr:alpha/beta hydrolase [Ancrocorticia sp.]MCI1932261.1 alpha/beta hydrolase [Ancrocorticia sp.]MCI2012315.1 alpha/beta hydrolase [Ancrocorticia sp.]MCI2028864.1 alpha/beta hydrolase [Ancrocorticia sp.]MCI2179064.1 alpha/beta hydrolase [Ancrocorticia sp.]
MESAASGAMDRLTRGLSIDDGELAGRHGAIPIRTYQAKNVEPIATLVWAHGGAFAFGGLDQLESHAVGAAIAQANIRVIAVDYHLVPAMKWYGPQQKFPLSGTRFPIPVDDVVDAFRAVLGEARPVLLGGASAGACLCASALRVLKKDGAQLPAAAIFAYGVFHPYLVKPDPELRQRLRSLRGVFAFKQDQVDRFSRNYAGSEAAMHDPMAFPGLAEPEQMPPTLFLDADVDSLRASSTQYALSLSQGGTDVTHTVVSNSVHGFLDRPGHPEFTAGIAAMAAWIKQVAHSVRE